MTAAVRSNALFAGVDGGGTGCRARIEDAEGRVLGTGIAGPATLRLVLASNGDKVTRTRKLTVPA